MYLWQTRVVNEKTKKFSQGWFQHRRRKWRPLSKSILQVGEFRFFVLVDSFMIVLRHVPINHKGRKKKHCCNSSGNSHDSHTIVKLLINDTYLKWHLPY